MQIADFYPIVAPDLPGCPDETLRRAIVASVLTLCSEARIWRELQDPIQLVDGLREYDIDAPAGGRITNIDEVFCGSRELPRLTLNELNWRLPDWQTSKGSSPAFYTSSNDWGSINVYPMPFEPTETIVCRAEYEPQSKATSLPDFILERYEDEIAMGTKARCMITKNVPWSDATMAEYWRARFGDAVSDAKIKMIHERSRGNMRVKPRPFR